MSGPVVMMCSTEVGQALANGGLQTGSEHDENNKTQ